MFSQVRQVSLWLRDYVVFDIVFGYMTKEVKVSISICTEPISGEVEERLCIKFVSARRGNVFQTVTYLHAHLL